MTAQENNNLMLENLASITDANLGHLLDCQAAANASGNSWGQALEAERRRRKAYDAASTAWGKNA